MRVQLRTCDMRAVIRFRRLSPANACSTVDNCIKRALSPIQREREDTETSMVEVTRGTCRRHQQQRDVKTPRRTGGKRLPGIQSVTFSTLHSTHPVCPTLANEVSHLSRMMHNLESFGHPLLIAIQPGPSIRSARNGCAEQQVRTAPMAFRRCHAFCKMKNAEGAKVDAPKICGVSDAISYRGPAPSSRSH
jgi:hypothetical protein